MGWGKGDGEEVVVRTCRALWESRIDSESKVKSEYLDRGRYHFLGGTPGEGSECRFVWIVGLWDLGTRVPFWTC